MTIKGTAGDDTLTGTSGNDVFNLVQGGEDNVSGLAGDDQFQFGATFDATDTVNGGDGNDTIKLDGDYSTELDLGAATIAGVERFLLTGGHSYDIKTVDANLAAGQTLDVDATHTHAGDSVIFNGFAETDGNFDFRAGAGSHQFFGGAGDDTFAMGKFLQNNDVVSGHGGNDTMILAGDYSARHLLLPQTFASVETIKVTAGNSYDLRLEGDQNAPASMTIDGHTLGAGDFLHFSLTASTRTSVTVSGGAGDDVLAAAVHVDSTLSGGAGNDMLIGGEQNDVLTGGTGNDTFDLTLGGNNSFDVVHGGSGDDTIIAGQLLTQDQIDGGSGNDTLVVAYSHEVEALMNDSSFLHIDTLDFGGSSGSFLREADGNVAAGDTMTVVFQVSHLNFVGSAETDGHFVFQGLDSNATMSGGNLADTFDYSGIAAFSSATLDEIDNFNFVNDIVKFAAVSAIDAEVTTGTLNSASFDTDLAAAVGAGQLGAGHAVLFQASAGDDAGNFYLIVDGNNTAGYQAGADLVIHLEDLQNTNHISTADFTA